MQCQRWWALADLAKIDQATSPFTVPSPLSPVDDGQLQFEMFQAPPTPALTFEEHRSPSTASSSFSYPPATAALNEQQMQKSMADGFSQIQNDAMEPRFASHFTPLGGFDQRFSSSGCYERGVPDEQYSMSLVPPTPRLEQEGFVPSPNPNQALQTSANKQNVFFQPVPTPARKIAIPRFQELGEFEPLLPISQSPIVQPASTIEQAWNSAETKKKRGWTKASAETIEARKRERLVGSNKMRKHNQLSIKHEVYTPGSVLTPGTLTNDTPIGAPGPLGKFYNANQSMLLGLDHGGDASTPRRSVNNTSYVLNSDEAAITPQPEQLGATSEPLNPNQASENRGLEICSPPMNHHLTSHAGRVPSFRIDTNLRHAGMGITTHNTIPFGSPMHSSPMMRSNSNRQEIVFL